MLTSLSAAFPLILCLGPLPLPQYLQSHRSETYIVPNVSQRIWLTGTIFFQESIKSASLKLDIERWSFVSSPVSGNFWLFTKRSSWIRLSLAHSEHSKFYFCCARLFPINTRTCTATSLAPFNEYRHESASHSAKLELSTYRVNSAVFYRGHNSY